MKTRLRIVLVEPRIAGNVGNVARTCLAAGAELHLVGPFGFILDEKRIKRASVNHWFELQPTIYSDGPDFWKRFESSKKTQWIFATKRGEEVFGELSFDQDVVLIFGNEELGVSPDFWKNSGVPDKIVSCRIPTVSVRCLNLSVSVGILTFEVIRQWGGIQLDGSLLSAGDVL